LLGDGDATSDLFKILDQLARSTRDLPNPLGGVIGVPAVTHCWTPGPTRPRLYGRQMLTDLNGLAEFERELICSLVTVDPQLKVKGVMMGRKPKSTNRQRQEALARRGAAEVAGRHQSFPMTEPQHHQSTIGGASQTANLTEGWST
jgi:hypothetical protein